ncbi:MAG: M48 family metalloprotease [Acidiferrobacterales bacterium]
MAFIVRGILPWIVLLAISPAYAGTQDLPDLGDEAAAIISPHEERKLGETLMRKLRRSLRFLDDPEINDYLQILGQRLVAHSDSDRSDFQFFVIDDPTINAFALPGGFIGINTGLILAAQSESELAAVMAHETAHITQRHLPRMFAESKRTSKQVMAALLAALVLAGAGESTGSQATLALASAGLAQKQLNFTRAHEEEADRVGIGILAGAEFDPQAMPTVFERMQNWGRLNETNLPEFLRTHPITSRRIAESRNRAERYPYRQVPDSAQFHHIRAKLRATGRGTPTEIVMVLKDNLDQGKYRNAAAERYGYTLALVRVKEYDAARKEMALLLGKDPDSVTYRILEAEIEMAAGQYDKALDILANAARKFPANRALQRYYATALLKTGHPQTARELLKKALKNHADDPALQKMLATAAGESGARLEAHQALASYYHLNGNLGAAIEQLQIAKRFAGDSFYIRSSLDARIKEIQEELSAQKKGRRN